MSDARSKLNDALANAASKRVASPPAAPSKPAPKSTPPAPKAPPKASAPKPKPNKKKKPPKPKKTGPGASSVMMKSLSKFANNMIDELKTATSEISPSALINTATDSIKSIKNAVGLNDQPSPQTPETTKNNPPPPAEGTQERAPSAFSATDATPVADTPASTPEIAPEPSAPPTSPAKVQRMPSKKKSSDASATPTEPAEPSQEDLLKQLTSDTVTPEPPAASSAKVERAPSKKKKTEDESSADTSSAEDKISELSPEDTEPASGVGAEVPTQETDLPLSAEAPEPPSTGSAQPSSQIKKPAPKPQAAVMSKTEHAVRGFQALQSLLTNPMWGPIITDPEIKPSSLYAPRERFDTNFSDPTFRAGLKAASRLASSFGFDPEKMRFNTNIIEKVKSVEIDPEGKIKPHTENISGVIGEEKVKEIMGIYHNKNFQHLLFSVGTRMGSFVPTIESLARIYLSLRKKEPLTSSARLQMQEEILMRYRKAPYTEEMGKKARNLAMKYFMDYLATYAIKLYKERFKDAPDGQNNVESHQRRHETIKSFCCDMIDEWAKKIALATPAIISMQAKFRDLADQHLEKVLADDSQEDRKAY